MVKVKREAVRAGKRQGDGIMRYATGQESSGTWKDGMLVAPAAPAPDAAATPKSTIDPIALLVPLLNLDKLLLELLNCALKDRVSAFVRPTRKSSRAPWLRNSPDISCSKAS